MFSNNNKIDVHFHKWQLSFHKALYACFKKIRVKDEQLKQSKMDKLMKEKKQITKNKNLSSAEEDQIEEIDKQISEECSEKEFEKLSKVLGELETVNGGTNSNNVWKEFRKAYSKRTKLLPTGIRNVSGKVITNPKEKKTCNTKTFQT